MAEGINKVILIGNLGANPELKYTNGGKAVTNLSVATNEKWGGGEGGGEPQERVEWHRVTAWGTAAEACDRFLRKGSQVYVEGRLQTEQWDDRDGQKRYTTKVIASRVLFLGGKDAGSSSSNGGGGQPPEQGQGGGGLPPEGPPLSDDELPF